MSFESSSSLDTTSFTGKVAVITGGSRGIGKAVADQLIKQGAKVVIGDILENEGNEVIDKYNKEARSKVAAFIRTDITKYSDNKALFHLAESEFGDVDYAILNAGVAANANTLFAPLDDEAEERIFNINAIGSKVALLHLAKRGGGSIVCLASVAGFFCAPDLNAYNSTKHAVVGYVRSCTLLPPVCNVCVNAGTELLDSIKTVNRVAEPYYETLAVAPHVSMDSVVEGVFTFLSDETRNAQTLMILPDGNRLMDAPELPACLNNESSLKARDAYIQKIFPHAKEQLAKAIERYNNE